MVEVKLSEYWDSVHLKKKEDEVSWFQFLPIESIELIKSLKINLNDNIIDVGAGESRLVDNLLELGFKNIDVLDISESAIAKAKKRLGKKSLLVNWIVCDINNFKPEKKYKLWHDRAAFHFLRKENEINNYVNLASNSILKSGKMIIATFSLNGPEKCSGLEVTRYSLELIKRKFKQKFIMENHSIKNHSTPFNSLQEFLFTTFSKI
jgi:SAM-dependent methyltransferase